MAAISTFPQQHQGTANRRWGTETLEGRLAWGDPTLLFLLHLFLWVKLSQVPLWERDSWTWEVFAGPGLRVASWTAGVCGQEENRLCPCHPSLKGEGARWRGGWEAVRLRTLPPQARVAASPPCPHSVLQLRPQFLHLPSRNNNNNKRS